jgi:hypothetical protein
VLYHSIRYQAKSWQHSRRVVAKVEWHAGKLLPRIGFIVTKKEFRNWGCNKGCNKKMKKIRREGRTLLQ